MMSLLPIKISFFCLFLIGIASAQLAPEPSFLMKKKFNIEVKKTGPYIGVQRGKYTVAEFGVERQWKKVKLSSSINQAVHMGVNYNFKYNVLGYDLGYWIKPNRIGLTYGGNLVIRTDFTKYRIGFTPVIGFKLVGFHLQTGYHFLSRSVNFTETNTFFISLRYVLINDRDVQVNKRKKSNSN